MSAPEGRTVVKYTPRARGGGGRVAPSPEPHVALVRARRGVVRHGIVRRGIAVVLCRGVLLGRGGVRRAATDLGRRLLAGALVEPLHGRPAVFVLAGARRLLVRRLFVRR